MGRAERRNEVRRLRRAGHMWDEPELELVVLGDDEDCPICRLLGRYGSHRPQMSERLHPSQDEGALGLDSITEPRTVDEQGS